MPGENKFAASVFGLIYLGHCSHITFAAFVWQGITYGHQDIGHGRAVGMEGWEARHGFYAVQCYFLTVTHAEMCYVYVGMSSSSRGPARYQIKLMSSKFPLLL